MAKIWHILGHVKKSCTIYSTEATDNSLRAKWQPRPSDCLHASPLRTWANRFDARAESGMINGELRSKIDSVWNSFWSGGVANPLSVIEQITYLLFIKRLDDLHTNEENKASMLGRPMAKRIFPEGKDGLETPLFRDGGCAYELMRWSRFKNEQPERMFEIVDSHVFPFLRELSGDGTALSKHMGKARFGIPTPRLLATVVDALDGIHGEDPRHTASPEIGRAGSETFVEAVVAAVTAAVNDIDT